MFFSLSLVFSSFLVIYLDVVFFAFVLCGYAVLEYVNVCFSPHMGKFQPLFPQFFFPCSSPFFLLFLDSSYTCLDLLLLSSLSVKLFSFQSFFVCSFLFFNLKMFFMFVYF